MPVPYFELKTQYKKFGKRWRAALLRAASSGKYVLSEEVTSFERNFAKYCRTKYSLGVGSGTDALIFALKAAGVGPGDEVIVPGFTFSATAFAAMHLGAVPVFVEVDPVSCTIDPVATEAAVTRKTRAILPVHLYGQMADMKRLRVIAKKHRIALIEDACQAHGAARDGWMAGEAGDAAAFSFYPTKNLGGFGDGGAVVTNDSTWAGKIQNWRNLGRIRMQDPHTEVGWTSRLDALQAAVLNQKLKFLEGWNHKRRELAKIYRQGLQDLPLILPIEVWGAKHVYHLYVARVQAERRDRFRDFLAKHGISSLIHYPVPVHKQPVILRTLKKKVHLPISERLSREIVSLPMYPELAPSKVQFVCKVIRKFFR